MRTFNLILLVLILTCQYRLWSDEGGIPQIYSLEDKIEEQKTINAELADRNLELHAQAYSLRSSQDAIEEIARSRQGLIKDGETLFIVFDPEEE